MRSREATNQIFSPEKSCFPHLCATCAELPTNISTSKHQFSCLVLHYMELVFLYGCQCDLFSISIQYSPVIEGSKKKVIRSQRNERRKAFVSNYSIEQRKKVLLYFFLNFFLQTKKRKNIFFYEEIFLIYIRSTKD